MKKEYEKSIEELYNQKEGEIQRGEEDGMNKIIQSLDIPDKLYRYRTLNVYGLCEILNNSIYLANPETFNDLYDCVANFKEQKELPYSYTSWLNYMLLECYKDYVKITERKDSDGKSEKTLMGLCNNDMVDYQKLMRDLSKIYRKQMEKEGDECWPNLDELSTAFCERFYELFKREVYEFVKIACFSKKNNNMPMWYHYADCYKGVCIEYDMKEMKEDFSKDIEKDVDKEFGTMLMMPVIYTSNFNRYIKGLKKRIGGLLVNALLKHKDWSYENEWRMISIDGTENEYKGAKISAVYFGPQADDNLIEQVRDMVDDKIVLYKMEVTAMGLRAKPCCNSKKNYI